jgi:hypothetical protein
VSTTISHCAAVSLVKAMVWRSSAQPTRRAVLQVQAPDDPPVPADLANWFAERAFHFYVAGVGLPRTAAPSARHAGRDMRPAFADLDAACRRLRRTDGMANVIVAAQGRAAVAAALWSDSRKAGEAGHRGRADALILSAPAWPARGSLHLNIACPVLVIGGPGANPARTRSQPRPRRPHDPGMSALQLGDHVTWVSLADSDPDRRLFLDQLGRWLGAYMYGPVRDQLL